MPHRSICCASLIHSASISFLLLFSERDQYSFYFLLLIQSWMFFASLVLNKLCSTQYSLSTGQSLCFHLFLCHFWLRSLPCLGIPKCILSFSFSRDFLTICLMFCTPQRRALHRVLSILYSLLAVLSLFLGLVCQHWHTQLSVSLIWDTILVPHFSSHISLLLLHWLLLQLIFLSLFTFFLCLWLSM